MSNLNKGQSIYETSCLGCLSENINIDVDSNLYKIYRSLVEEKFTDMDIKKASMGICPNCEKLLLTYKTFAETCKKNGSVLQKRLIEISEQECALLSNMDSKEEIVKLEDLDETNDMPSELVEAKIKLEFQIETGSDSHTTSKKKGHASRVYIPRMSEITDLCTVCSLKVIDWNDHIKQYHAKFTGKNVRCSECSYVTSNFHRLKKHFPQHIRLLTPIQCKGCSRNQFETFLVYKNHWYKEHVRPKFQCNECGQVCKARHYFKNHFFIKHRPSVLYCKHCYIIFSNLEEFQAHKSQIEKRQFKKYVCHICGKNVTKSLSEHLKYSHPTSDISVECETCGHVFPNIQRMRLHNREVHNERRYPCNICNKRFENKGKVERHVKQVHMDKEYQNCSVCGSRLVAHGLILHMRMSHPEIESYAPKKPRGEKRTRIVKKCEWN